MNSVNERKRWARLRSRLEKRIRSGKSATGMGGRRRSGLTLIELAIVILVLGILFTIVYRSINFGITDDARRLSVQASSKQLSFAWERYEFDHPQLEDNTPLTKLSQKNPDDPAWRPVDENLIMDPWKRPYFICRDENGERQICSYGADGKPGGTGKDSDFFLTDPSHWPAWLSGKKEGE